MFAKKGIIVVPKAGQDEDQILSIALDAGADDLRTDDPDYFEIQTSPEQFEKVLNAVNAAGIPIEEDKVGLIASTMVKVEDAEAEKLAKLIEMLEENEDVQNVYSNAQF
jgi:transcriptional/translational regulatory protein YebC/TACO1